jgi:hypothetical protein
MALIGVNWHRLTAVLPGSTSGDRLGSDHGRPSDVGYVGQETDSGISVISETRKWPALIYPVADWATNRGEQRVGDEVVRADQSYLMVTAPFSR